MAHVAPGHQSTLENKHLSTLSQAEQ